MRHQFVEQYDARERRRACSDMRAAGMRLGLGTDGPAGSNNDLNIMEEMDLTAKLQKVTRRDPRALNAEAALEMATIGGARALHMESEIGSLEPGKKADLIILASIPPTPSRSMTSMRKSFIR